MGERPPALPCGEAARGELFDDPVPVESLAGYLHGMAYGARLFGPDDSAGRPVSGNIAW
ncbi:hypothetical protein ABZ490_44505 [Streptomyces sp. NPDC005811]|uniref:hypothetical protein n=1 Tax=Streptomyces sp. NPDC005811 TaxID=3154565 RepID=UPI003403CEF5